MIVLKRLIWGLQTNFINEQNLKIQNLQIMKIMYYTYVHLHTQDHHTCRHIHKWIELAHILITLYYFKTVLYYINCVWICFCTTKFSFEHWTWGLIWSVVDIPSFATLEQTPFPSRHKMHIAAWLGLWVHIPFSVLGFCLIWTYAGLVNAVIAPVSLCTCNDSNNITF